MKFLTTYPYDVTDYDEETLDDFDYMQEIAELNAENVDILCEHFRTDHDAVKALVIGKGVGWQNRTGARLIDLEYADLTEELAVNSPYTQRWEYDQDAMKLTCLLSHHDSPMGESYEFFPITEEWFEELCDKYEEDNGCDIADIEDLLYHFPLDTITQGTF